jgi:arsenate reductase
MKEEGYDLSGKETSNAFDFYKQGKKFQYVIVVCEKETEEKCPIYPGSILRLHWDFEDPSRASGTHEQQLQVFRTIRDQIKRKVRCFTEVI